MAAEAQVRLRQSRRRRILQENLTAYAFLTPAAVLIFLFGLFPLAFAFFVSLHRWRRFPDEYVGLENYERALGDLSYAVFFWLGLAALGLGVFLLWRLLRATILNAHAPSASPSDRGEETESTTPPAARSGILYLLPGAVNAAAILLFIWWASLALPVILNIPLRLRGQERVQGLFVNELFASFRFPEVADAGNTFLLAAILAILVSVAVTRTRLLRGETAGKLLWTATGALLSAAAGILILQLAQGEMTAAIEAARAEGTELPLWSQIVLISVGVLVLGVAYWLWRRAVNEQSDRRFLLLALAAVLLLGGGYLLVAELPRIMSSADNNMLGSFGITVMYAALAVPVQLAIGLGLAYLLFQNLRGKTVFRMIFFLPYIMPFIATSIVFSLLFSHREDSIINNLIGAVGIPPQKWLLEPTPIGKLVFGPDVPSILNGPSLALLVIIIYTIWTYAGYAAVVFLAGLGNIPSELYEAARIDGANGWQLFRHITLPLLSPTTFFLSLVAIIGTFQAFTQLWILRNPASSRTTDTLSIYIFRQLTDSNPNYGYGSALAFVLFGVILLLTIFQNRIAGRRVFYG